MVKRNRKTISIIISIRIMIQMIKPIRLVVTIMAIRMLD